MGRWLTQKKTVVRLFSVSFFLSLSLSGAGNDEFPLSSFIQESKETCVCVCVWGGGGGEHVYVVYEDTNLYNDMGIT